MSAINQQPSLIDRASALRTDVRALEELWRNAKVIHCVDGRLASKDGELQLFDAVDIGAELAADFTEGSRYFLGRDLATKTAYFALDTDWIREASEDEAKLRNRKFGLATLRELGSQLNDLQMELALHAVALSNWHRAHPMCPRCGAPTRVDLGGAARVCEHDGSQHHPRTDSAVIVLIKDRADRILLGHQPVWPEGRYSTFAGFLEPGETFEQCVKREVFEESHLEVTEIHYLGSQPWPFPASIMIAFEAVTDNPDGARGDGEEITDVRWFTRKELMDAARDGSLLLPPTMSVARKMIERWLGQKAPGGETWR
jgi:NAD+ diphosphatase